MLQPLKVAPVEFKASNGIMQWWTACTCTVICEYDRYPEDVFYSWSSLTLQALLDYERFKTGIPVPGSSQRGGQIDGPYLGGDNQGTVSPATPSSQVWIYASTKWANPLGHLFQAFVGGFRLNGVCLLCRLPGLCTSGALHICLDFLISWHVAPLNQLKLFENLLLFCLGFFCVHGWLDIW